MNYKNNTTNFIKQTPSVNYRMCCCCIHTSMMTIKFTAVNKKSANIASTFFLNPQKKKDKLLNE